MLIGNEWKMQTNMKTKLTLLVFQKHHNFTCWLAMNEKCKQYDNKIYSLGLSKTSQFYMLIGNKWKMQTIWKQNLLFGLSKTSQFYMLIGNEWKMQRNMINKIDSLGLEEGTVLVFQKHHNFTCWLAMNEKCKQIWKQNWLSWSFKNITILHVDWQWMKNANKYENKMKNITNIWLAISWSFKNITILHVDWQWMKNANNMKTKLTLLVLVFQKHHNFTCWLAMNEKCKQIWKQNWLLVFQKHHNFTCWLAINEKCKQYDNKIDSLGLEEWDS